VLHTHGIREAFVHRAHVVDRHAGKSATQFSRYRAFDDSRILARANEKRDGTLRKMLMREVHFLDRRLTQSAIVHVFDHADDGSPNAWVAADRDALTDRILIAKHAARGGLVDHSLRLTRRIGARVHERAANDAHAQRGEKSRVDESDVGRGNSVRVRVRAELPGSRVRMPRLNEHRVSATLARRRERKTRRDADRLNGRELRESRSNLLVGSEPLRRSRIRRLRQRQSKRQHPLGRKSRIGACQPLEARHE